MQLKQTLKELQRRHVVKAGIAYLVVSWLIIQVLSILIPTFEASPNAMKTALLILGIGFPIWLVIAWIYDFSPDGIKKTDAVTYNQELSRKKNIGLNRFIIGGLSIAIILLLFNTFRMNTKIDSINQKALASNFTSSIAVLAFDDLSPEQDQEYFAKGLSQQIQQRLTKQKDLKVINTITSNFYQDKDISIEVIGQELDVSFVLNGSVLKSGETFRVNVDLVDTKDESIIWSKQFDQKVEDILYTFDEIAKAVVEYLKLTFDYQDVRLRKVDPEAYDLFLKAEITMLNGAFTKESIMLGDSLIKHSLKIDDTYANSWVVLSQTTLHRWLYHKDLEEEEALSIGVNAAKKAIEKDSLFAGGYNWLSNYQWHTKDIEGHISNSEKAFELAPNDYSTLMFTYWNAMRMNKMEEAYTTLKKAVLLNPLDPEFRANLGFTALYYDDYELALSSMKKAIEISPGWADGGMELLGRIYVKMENFEMALSSVEKEPTEYWRTFGRSLVFFANGKIDESDALIEKLKTMESLDYWYPKEFILAELYALRGDKDQAFEYLEHSYDNLIPILDSLFSSHAFKVLYDDPRWDKLLVKIGKEFNYDFSHKT